MPLLIHLSAIGKNGFPRQCGITKTDEIGVFQRVTPIVSQRLKMQIAQVTARFMQNALRCRGIPLASRT